MLAAIRRAVHVPALPIEGVVAMVTGLAFVWLLAQGLIRPLAIYILQLYLWL